jgi:hypothetical protein
MCDSEWTLVYKVDECKLTLYINIYIYIYAGLLRGGCAEKETTMAEERWWKAPGMVALTSTETKPYLVFTGPENQERLAGPEMNYSLGW